MFGTRDLFWSTPVDAAMETYLSDHAVPDSPHQLAVLAVGDQVEVVGELDGAGQLLQDVDAEAFAAEFGVGLGVTDDAESTREHVYGAAASSFCCLPTNGRDVQKRRLCGDEGRMWWRRGEVDISSKRNRRRVSGALYHSRWTDSWLHPNKSNIKRPKQ